jgi:quinolinate synthase
MTIVTSDIETENAGTRDAVARGADAEGVGAETVPQIDLAYTPEIADATREVYERLKDVIPEVEWPVHAPYVAAINELKVQRNAIILAHNYMTPEIFHGVADLKGDSLALAQRAADTEAEIIVLAGVHFMA